MPDKSSPHQQLAKELNSILTQDDWPGEIAAPADNDPAPEYRMDSKGKRLVLIKTRIKQINSHEATRIENQSHKKGLLSSRFHLPFRTARNRRRDAFANMLLKWYLSFLRPKEEASMAAKIAGVHARAHELCLSIDRRSDLVVIDPSRFAEIARAMMAASYFDAVEAFGAALKDGNPEPLNGRVWTAKDGVSPTNPTS